MTDVPPQDQPPIDDLLDETDHADRTRRMAQPPPSQLRRRSQSRAQRQQSRQSPSRSSAARAAPPPPAAAPASYAAPPQPRRARRPAPPPPALPGASGLYLPWWSLVVLVVIVGGVAFGMLFVFAELSQPQTPGDQPPRIQIITSQPTLSQDFGAGVGNNPAGNQGQGDFWPTPIPQVQPSATVPLPTLAPSPSLPPGNFVIGARVLVVGVGTSGLNVRSTPGLAGTPLFLAIDDETYAIVDGPQTADGLEWWKIEDPDDPSRSGWAARNYLTVQ